MRVIMGTLALPPVCLVKDIQQTRNKAKLYRIWIQRNIFIKLYSVF